MKTILFLINSLGNGGAERALVNLVEQIDQEKYCVTVKTLYDEGVYINEIKKMANYESAKMPLIRGMNYLYKFIPAKILHSFFVKKKYDIEVAFLEGITTKIVSGGNNLCKKIAWVRIDVEKYIKNERCYLSRKHVIESYKRMDAIAFVGTDALDSFRRKYGIKERLSVVRNIFKYDDMLNKSKEICEVSYKYYPVFGSVGRLIPQKGYEKLLDIHARLLEEGYSHTILIVGDGPQKKKLLDKIKKYHVEDSFILVGYQSNPFKYYKTFDWFISSSMVEGLASVLREAVLLGVPIIATECSGVREILGNSEYGMVVNNDEGALYQAMKQALCDDTLIEKYKKSVLKRQSFFDYNETVNCNLSFIDKIAGV